MNKNKRNFLKGAALSALTIPTTTNSAETADTKPASAAKRQHWAMVVDLAKCIACQACTVACAMENDVPIGKFRTIVNNYEIKLGQQVHSVVLPRLCNHCEQPPCIPVCPVQATYKRSDGIVVIDNQRCVGCGYCVQACPYDARFINPRTQTADKCTFCLHRVEAGLLPACVETCVGGARIFGDLNNKKSIVATIVENQATQVLRPEMKTQPQVFYLGLDQRFQSKVEGSAVNWHGQEISKEQH